MSAPNHAELKVALAGFVRAACDRLAGNTVPVAPVTLMRYQADGSGQGEQRWVAAPGGIVNALLQEWTGWPSFKKLQQEVVNAPLASAYLLSNAVGQPMDDAEGHVLSMVLARFLSDYFQSMASLQIAYEDEAYELLWREFIETIHTGLGNVDWWAPIYNAEWVGDPTAMALDDASTLREPPPDVMLELVSFGRHSQMFEPQAWLQVAAKVNLKVPPIEEPPLVYASNLAAAIRLVVGGHAFARTITMLPRRGVPGGYGQFSGWRGRPVAWWSGIQSVLDPAIQPKLVERFAQLQKLGGPFEVVLRRYEAAVSKLDANERLIDATIGLESLLLGGSGSPTEVTFRFALTGAWLLADEPTRRIEVFRLLTELYGRRSDIVHGDRQRIRKLPPNPENVAVELLRELLTRMLDSGRSWDEWIVLRHNRILGLDEGDVERRSGES